MGQVKIMDEGTVRITFDSDVRAAVGSYDIFDPSLPTLPVLEPGKLVMEVKFTEMLPQIVRDLLPPNAQEFTAVSKYVLCYEKSQYLHGFEYWNETQERKLLKLCHIAQDVEQRYLHTKLHKDTKM